ncbi:MgtC/SapB family protein [Methylobacterium sp. J-077]|uniref:MgtC/SapB family protein n=1 Tax=Methylobacterium sp. J-077 TaxID=2836656 RepID=UPI001FB96290|nr:MgtC/SapB family protein [Methylobacterium sp. J-077]MCJ2124101.1 MgtC/SapB family protein [Methylobacterium sp. J-077]
MTGDLALDTVAIRLGLSFLAAFALGWNREELGHPAGLRTTVLICVSACTAMLLATWLMARSGDSGDSQITLDLMRLAQGVLGGIGFIGAGTILKQGNIVRGVTTAATLWLATVAGLCFGAGAWQVGAAATLVGLATLQGLGRLEDVLRRRTYGTVTVEFGAEANPAALLGLLDEVGLRVRSTNLAQGRDGGRLRCIGSHQGEPRAWALAALTRLQGAAAVNQASWEDMS